MFLKRLLRPGTVDTEHLQLSDKAHDYDKIKKQGNRMSNKD